MLLLKALSPFWLSLISLCVSLNFQGGFWHSSSTCTAPTPQAAHTGLFSSAHWAFACPRESHTGPTCWEFCDVPFFSSTLLKSSKTVQRWRFSSDLLWISRPSLISSGNRQVCGLNMLLDTICLNKNTWLVKVNTCKKLCQL